MSAKFEPAADQALPESRKAVLFVEDDSNDFILAQYHLKNLKLRNPVRCVPCVDILMDYLDGKGAFADRKQFPLPGVIILDQRLPGTAGLQVQARLRATLRFRDIPIIAISSPERVNILKSAVDLGANAYMLKPFRADDFCKLTRQLKLPLDFELV